LPQRLHELAELVTENMVLLYIFVCSQSNHIVAHHAKSLVWWTVPEGEFGRDSLSLDWRYKGIVGCKVLRWDVWWRRKLHARTLTHWVVIAAALSATCDVDENTNAFCL
jgi:hypothetical protein